MVYPRVAKSLRRTTNTFPCQSPSLIYSTCLSTEGGRTTKALMHSPVASNISCHLHIVRQQTRPNRSPTRISLPDTTAFSSSNISIEIPKDIPESIESSTKLSTCELALSKVQQTNGVHRLCDSAGLNI